jgi:hypothetical protein
MQMKMTFKEYYVQVALDRVNAAESQLRLDLPTDEVIRVVDAIKRARREYSVRQEEVKHFADALAYLQFYEDKLKDAEDRLTEVCKRHIEHGCLGTLIGACDQVRKCVTLLNKAQGMVHAWKEHNNASNG